ncbi:MAG: oligosaccharide flippase family protein [Patescibacteria group bacterium]
MINKVKALSKSSFIQGTLIVTVGSFIGSIFNYVLQLGLARTLSVEDFGVFSALLSMAVIFSVPTSAFIQSIIKSVVKLKATDAFDTLTKLYLTLSLYALFLGFLLFSGLHILATPIQNYLNLDNWYIFRAFTVYMGLSFILIPTSSYLQGLLRFKAFAFYVSVTGFVRMVIPLTLVYLGYRVGGIFYGMTAVAVIMYLVGGLLLWKNFVVPSTESVKDYYKEILQFGVATLFVSIGMSLLNNVDVLMVKHLFSSYESGIYAGVVTLGKVFLFGAGMVTVVMYPQIASLKASGRNYMRRFYQFLSLQLILVSGGVIAFVAFPRLLTITLFGHSFDSAISYLPMFSIFVALYILVNFFIMFNLAVNNTNIWKFLLPTAFAQYLLIHYFHRTLDSIIYINISVTVLLLLCLIAFTWYNLRDVSIDNNSSL